MSSLIDLLSWGCFLLGGFLCLTGGVGLLRFPDFFSRVHAVGVTETLATPLLLIGVMLQLGPTLDSGKLLLVMAFVLATNPTASNAMAKAALRGGQKPLVVDDDVDGAAMAKGDTVSKP